jgi:hypothetical protein
VSIHAAFPHPQILPAAIGLITEDAESGITRLVHYTTQTYLERKLTTLLDAPAPNPRHAISIKCLRYLSFAAPTSGPCAKEDKIEERLKCNPFMDHAAHYWSVHIRRSEVHDQKTEDNNRIAEVAELFLDRSESVKSAVQLMHRQDPLFRHDKVTIMPQVLLDFSILRLLFSLVKRGLDTTPAMSTVGAANEAAKRAVLKLLKCYSPRRLPSILATIMARRRYC